MKRVLLIIFSFLLLTGLSVCAEAQTRNPSAPDSPWPEGHGTYCQQNTSQPSFTDSTGISLTRIPFGSSFDGFSPSGTIVSEKYPNGAFACWGTNGNKIFKMVIDGEKTNLIYADDRSIGYKVVSGYWVMRKDKVCYFMSDWKIYELQDKNSTDPYSPIICTAVVPITSLKGQAQAGLNFAIGMKMLYNGLIVITTRQGKVGVFDPDLKKLVQVIDLKEKIQNNMAVEEGDYVYLNTNSGTFQFKAEGGRLRRQWFASTPQSGSTPTLMNVGGDSLVMVTTDSQEPTQLIALWRHQVPARWRALTGYDRRVAGVIEIDFGKEAAEPTENSLLVADSTILTANWTGLWPYLKKDNPGVTAYTWSSDSHSFRKKWTNERLTFPNSMQALSVPSNTAYAVGRRSIKGNRVWTFEAFDWSTGQERFHLLLGDEKLNNATGSGIQIAWNGDIIFMTPKAAFRLFKAIPGSRSKLLSQDASRKEEKIKENLPEIKVYPNPAQGSVLLKGLPPGGSAVELLDVTGWVLKTWAAPEGAVRFNLSGYPRGLYYLRVTTKEKSRTVSIMIEGN